MRSSQGRWLIVVLVAYGALALPIAISFSTQINPDGVSYLRIATYYLHGDFAKAISGYWSPLYSWLLAPWLALGVPGLLAAKLLGIVLALAWICALWRLGARYLEGGYLHAFLIVCACGMALAWMLELISPDLLLAALLTTYFALVSDPATLTRPARSVACGLCGGLAYLAKAYAFPFFLAHFVGTVVIHAWAEPRPRPLKRYLACAVTGMLGFAALAGPWVAVLSVQYGRLTFSTAGDSNRPLAHSQPAHSPVAVYIPPQLRLYAIEPGRLTPWEAPDRIRVTAPELSSALTDSQALRHQVTVIAKNAIVIRDKLSGFDYFHLAIPAVLGTAFVAFLRRLDRREAARDLWGVFTVALYGAGFLPLYAEVERYYWPIVGLLLILTLGFATSLAKASFEYPGERGAYRTASRATVILAAVVAASYLQVAMHMVIRFYNTPRPDYHRLATQLTAQVRSNGTAVQGPIAGNDWERTIYLAYALDLPMYGTPTGQEPAALAEELASFGIRTYLVFGDPSQAARLQGYASFRHLGTVDPSGASADAVAAFEVRAVGTGR